MIPYLLFAVKSNLYVQIKNWIYFYYNQFNQHQLNISNIYFYTHHDSEARVKKNKK